jgi:hypothetical protein
MAALKLEEVFCHFPQKTFTISALVKSQKDVESLLENDCAFLTACKRLCRKRVVSASRSAFDKVDSHGAQAMTSKILIIWVIHCRMDNHTGSTCNETHGARLPDGPYQVCYHHSTETVVIVKFILSTKFSLFFYYNLSLKVKTLGCLNL